MFRKEAALYESSGVVDPGTNLTIRTTAAVRKQYREVMAGQPGTWRDKSTGEEVSGTMEHAPNSTVTKILEDSLASNATGVVHHWGPLKKGGVGEIRVIGNNNTSYTIFISAIRQGSIDIIKLQTTWKQPPKWHGG